MQQDLGCSSFYLQQHRASLTSEGLQPVGCLFSPQYSSAGTVSGCRPCGYRGMNEGSWNTREITAYFYCEIKKWRQGGSGKGLKKNCAAQAGGSGKQQGRGRSCRGHLQAGKHILCLPICLSVCLQPQPRLASTSQPLALTLRASGHPFGGKHGEPEPPALPCPPRCFPSLLAAHLENSCSCRTKKKKTNKPQTKKKQKKTGVKCFV